MIIQSAWRPGMSLLLKIGGAETAVFQTAGFRDLRPFFPGAGQPPPYFHDASSNSTQHTDRKADCGHHGNATPTGIANLHFAFNSTFLCAQAMTHACARGLYKIVKPQA